jgi:STE24 endopeptidase
LTLPSQAEPHADTPEARQYNRIRRRLGIADFLLGLAFLLVLLLTGWTNWLHDVSASGSGDNYIFGLFLYVLMLTAIGKVISLPLDQYGFRLEHRFHLSNQKLRSWLWDETKGWLVGFVMAVLAAEFVYWMMRVFPQKWWLVCWGVFIGVFILLAQIAPVVLFPIFYKFKPLENESLKGRLLRLGERAGTRVRGVYEWKLSEKSKKANAALTGLGNTRRIILADTLLQNYSDDEIEAVLAHELGHHVHGHIWKSILVQVLVTLLGFYASARVLHWAVKQQDMFPSISYYADLPLLVLVSTVISFVLMPALNAWSRHNERQADEYSFKSISTVQPFISSMNKLADQNLAEREPSRMVELLFHSHPAISKRIQAAYNWAQTHGQSLQAAE